MSHPTARLGVNQGCSRQQLGVQAAMGQGPGPYTCGIAGKHVPQSGSGHGRACLQELPSSPVSGGDDAARSFQQHGGAAFLGGGKAGFQCRQFGQIGK